MEEEWRKKMEEWRKEMEEMELPCIEFEFGGILPGVVAGAASHSHDKSKSSILRDIFRRQLGSACRQLGSSEALIRRLGRYTELIGHKLAVNSVSFNSCGELLVSGSDDCHVIIWDWARAQSHIITKYWSGHYQNVLQAEFMPYGDDHDIITCGADGQVRCGTILQDGTVSTKQLMQHRGRAHKLALAPGSSHVFYSCGEDGIVGHFDLRVKRSMELLVCHLFAVVGGEPRRPGRLQLNAIVTNPVNSNYFVVGGSDALARVYDIRRVQSHGLKMEDRPVECYEAKHLQGSSKHITCVAYSRQGELLASYNDELIYLFGKSMSLEEEGPQAYQGHQNFECSLSLPLYGHRNDVSFWGPSSEYVISGSNCGHIFIWKKKGGILVAKIRGAVTEVKHVASHPHATILASSGHTNRPTVQVWSPESQESYSTSV